MLPVPKWRPWAAGHETTQQVPKLGQAEGSGSREQPVPGKDGTVPQVAIVGHEGQQVP